MTALDKESLRDDLYHAIKKVMDKHREGSGLDILTTDSTEVFMTNAAMVVIETTGDAQKQWEDNGYLKL